MIIKNASVYCDGNFVTKDIYTDNGFFSETSGDDLVFDAKGLKAIPSLVDIHSHGAVGFDYSSCTASDLKSIAEYQAKSGICAVCPANVAMPIEKLESVVKMIANYSDDKGSDLVGNADFVGVHIEGPFLNPEKRGAHNPDYLVNPMVSYIDRLIKSSGDKIKIISFAPELPGSSEVIEKYKDKITLSVAHTSANYDTAKQAFDEGMKHVTHTFNAMPPFLHRDPSVIGAALDSEHVFAEVIADGIHVHPSAVRALFKMFSDDRMVLVSDSMSATGLSDGEYLLGDLTVQVNNKKATLADGTIAGSATNLAECFKKAVVDMKIPLVSAVKAASENPAKAVGIFDKYGSIQNGKIANLILFDDNLEFRKIMLKGRFI